jgi:D-glycero-D-manno-heptose 1,7-bisphosphate phosphatase
MTRGVVLDRDGTLIDFYRDPELGVVTPAFHRDHVRFLPGVIQGLTMLRDAGYAFAIASNQPHAAKGQLPLDAIDRTNETLLERLRAHGFSIDAFERCPHFPQVLDGSDPALSIPCTCRKPAPGMLEKILDELGWARDESWMIGDTAADLGAAHAARLRCALLMQTRRCEPCVLPNVALNGLEPALRAPRLDELARAIIGHPTDAGGP